MFRNFIDIWESKSFHNVFSCKPFPKPLLGEDNKEVCLSQFETTFLKETQGSLC